MIDLEKGRNSLSLFHRACWRRLLLGAEDGGHAFHTPALATLGPDGRPRARVVVLRAALEKERSLRFHCDRRSPKLREIEAEARVALLFYDGDEGLQLRAEAMAQIHVGDAVARQAWESSRLSSRRCYLQAEGPSAPAEAPTSGLPDYLEIRLPSAAESRWGFENFAAVSCRVSELDGLLLSRDGHRRAHWRYDGEGKAAASWLVP